VIEQASRGISVRENAAIQISPLLDDYFVNDVPFKDSLPVVYGSLEGGGKVRYEVRVSKMVKEIGIF
jgi:hypothetical protein